MVDLVLAHVIPATYEVLGERFEKPAATAMLLAIGLQESRFMDRRQVVGDGRPGPARGFWQFERISVVDVLERERTKMRAREVLRRLRYGAGTPDPDEVHRLLEHNDVLACSFARLKLYLIPEALPDIDEPEQGWRQYLSSWAPGKPHPETWPNFYVEAWTRVRA